MADEHAAFGAVLRQLRTAAALSQEALAECAGLSLRGISDLERGVRRAPHLATVRLLAEALALGPEDRQALLTAARPETLTGPNSAGPFPHATLPAPPNQLIGRTEEVATITALLRDPTARLLTVTGAGGSGKTRVAIESAGQVRTEFPDGVVFVDLAPLRDPALVAGAITTALGVREQPGRTFVQTVGEALAARRLLLVLDNFEHLLPATVVVRDLLAATTNLKVLTTSRARLALAAEQELPILPLAVPDLARLPPLEQLRDVDSVCLFMTRVQSIKPNFSLTGENGPIVAALCHRLDGLPLALELAAARIKLLPPQALLKRLEHSLPLLTGGARDLPTRQQTLRNTIAWSHDLLSADERILFRRLGGFVGGWTLEAAEVVANVDGSLNVLDGMAALIDESLVRQIDQAGAEPRFTMLETIREFSREQLHQHVDEADSVGQAHAAWYLELATAVAPQIFLVGEPAILDRLIAEYDNLRAALAWFSVRNDAEALVRLTGALGWFWQVAASGQEGLVWLERTLGISAGTSPSARIGLLAGAVFLLVRMGDHQRATALGEELLALAREERDQEGEAAAWWLLSRAANQREANAEAMTYAEKALALFRELRPTPWLPWALQRLGIEAHISGDYDRAAALHEEALEQFRAAGNAIGTAFALRNLGLTRHRMGDRREAAALYRGSLTLHRDVAGPWETATVLGQLASLVAEFGHAERAALLLGAAEGLYQSSGTTLQPYARDVLDPAEAEARTRLGPEAYAAAWGAGRKLPLRQAIGEGLEAVTAIDEELALEGSSPEGV